MPFLRPLILAVLSLPLISQTLSAAEPAPGVQQLFDGKTLSGWEGDPQYWRVEKGAIVGEIPRGSKLTKNTWLVWQGGDLHDFDLQLQVKLTGLPAANSGIQFRSQVKDIEHVSGYQADLDIGATWFGRIYDEHGRELLVERGTRVHIAPNGQRRVEVFAPANQYAVLFRDNGWNDYRIVAVGPHIAVYVNGALFSELLDEQTGEQDLHGKLAFQLHSGPETRVEFRNIQLQTLPSNDSRLAPFAITKEQSFDASDRGVVPTGTDGKPLNLGFEKGNLDNWTAEGEAFRGQPVDKDTISRRWPGQKSNKEGLYFIGGHELVGDRAVGTLTSDSFRITHPYASFLVGGGYGSGISLELHMTEDQATIPEFIFVCSGDNREAMRRVAVDLRECQGWQLKIRLVDESQGSWGHINFDDFRFHNKPPVEVEIPVAWRSTHNPVLSHLQATNIEADKEIPGSETISQMFVPQGFSVDVVAAEPDLHQPMAFTFDPRGRLWVVEGYCYPQKQPEGKGLDRILIFSDEDHDGKFEKRTVFAEGLNLVSGIAIGYGGVWVGAAPDLMFIPDRNGDDVPDSEPQILLNGFGYGDTHETLNNFMWGPDGWLYGNQGVFNTSHVGKPGTPDNERQLLHAGVWRYHPTRHVFEVFAHGSSNPWGLDYDQMGQIFMTHCRSFWGKGGTTHVMQGGHYWNQTNSRYAPFISRTAPSNRPWLVNYLLASARYDHGAGGAGKPGTDEVYGGHSHVGTMIYLGDNWPEEYRGHLFTNNLHGHQINHQINLREGGGFNTVHAGTDMLFCGDQQYLAVDLQYGPDGAVYISDWYDPRHCHNAHFELWDRGNGRIYRMKYDATWKPVAVNYDKASDLELVAALRHANEWHVRAARLVLSGRAAERAIDAAAIEQLRAMALKEKDPVQQLRGLWTLFGIGQFTPEDALACLQDENEYLRAWGIQLALECVNFEQQPGVWKTAWPQLSAKFVNLAQNDPSLVVQRYLASAIQRVPEDLGWELSEAIAARPDSRTDRDLPALLWHGLAQLTLKDQPRALRLAASTKIPAIADDIDWYLAGNSPEAREQIVQRILKQSGKEQLRSLEILEFALRDLRNVKPSPSWPQLAAALLKSDNPKVVEAAESIGVSFGDETAYQRIRKSIAGGKLKGSELQRQLQRLAEDPSPENLPLFVSLLENKSVAIRVIPMLTRFNDQTVAEQLLQRFSNFSDAETSAAMEVLCSRAVWANLVLDSIAAGKLPKTALTAFYAQQMANLNDTQLNDRLAQEWGRLGKSSAELKAEAAKIIAHYKGEALWAYNRDAGAVHFQKLCAACHLPNGDQEALAPKLAGSGAKGIEYFVENILDPNAVIGRDFQARIIQTIEGRIITGLVVNETDSALTIRTQNDTIVVPKSEIEEVRVSPNSFMPEGLLKTLNDQERMELFKYLMTM